MVELTTIQSQFPHRLNPQLSVQSLHKPIDETRDVRSRQAAVALEHVVVNGSNKNNEITREVINHSQTCHTDEMRDVRSHNNGQ